MTAILIALILLAAAMIMQAYHNHLTNEVIKGIKIELDRYKTLVDVHNGELAVLNFRVQQLKKLNTKLKKLNSNGATLTDKYDPLNPSKVFYDTNTHVDCHAQEVDEAIRKAVSSASILDLVDDTLSTTSQQLPPEAIHFTKEE